MAALWIACFIWGLSFALAKKSLSFLTPFELVAVRLGLGAMTSALLSRALPAGSGGSTGSGGRSSSKYSNVRATALLGLLEFAGTYIFYTWSLSYLPSGVVAMLTLLTPAVTFVLGWFVKLERLDGKNIAAIVLSFAGAFLCLPGARLVPELPSAPPGDLVTGVCLIMISNTFFAAGNVLIHRWQRDGKLSRGLTSGALGWGAVAAIAVALATKRSDTSQWSDLHAWLIPIFLGVVATGIGFSLWNEGVRRTAAFKASVVGNFKGPLAVVWGVVLLGETFSVKFAAGIILLMTAVRMLSKL